MYRIVKGKELSQIIVKSQLYYQKKLDWEVLRKHGVFHLSLFELENEFLLISNNQFIENGIKQAIICSNLETIFGWIKEDKYPINSLHTNFMIDRQALLLNFKSKNELYLHFLSKCGVIISLLEDKDYVLKQVEKLMRKRDDNKFIISCFLLFQYILRHKEVDWMAEKHYGEYHPYYVPVLYSKKTRRVFKVFTDFFEVYWDNSSKAQTRIRSYVKLKFEDFPGRIISQNQLDNYIAL